LSTNQEKYKQRQAKIEKVLLSDGSVVDKAEFLQTIKNNIGNTILMIAIFKKMNKEIFENIIEEKKSIIKNNLNSSTRFNFITKSGYKSLLASPLVEDEDVYGVLFVANEDKFAYEELNRLNTLATQASFLIKKNQLFEKMQRNVAELSTLQRVSKIINSTLDLDQVMDLAIDVIVGTMGVSSCAIMLVEEDNNNLNLEASRGLLEQCETKDNLNISKCKFAAEALKSKRPVIYNEVPEEIKKNMGIPELKSGIAVPLKLREDVIGIIVAVNTLMIHSFTKDDERFLTTLANQVAIALENARIYNRMEEMAIKDGLTQLYNHSHFQETLFEEINRATRYDQALSLLMLDIDNFKDFNDTYGHPVGDEVLKSLAKTLQDITRDIDTVARYGGEEFTIILPETTIGGAKEVACRINQAVRDMIIEENDLKLSVTVSIGAATYNSDLSQKELINNADKALYRAKESGKDKTCVD
jgi:diguanylate cyclase (GGDEF)-like protein